MNALHSSDQAGQVFLDLRKKANTKRGPVAELLTLYALSGSLGRLSESAEARATFVLKGEYCSLPTTHAGPLVMLTCWDRTASRQGAG